MCSKISINYHSTRFAISASDVKQLPKHTGYEIAFVGRSNAGKSSALNALAGQKKLAKTSKTPGRTRLINLFKVTQDAFLVDLPGYGYAAAAISIKQKWQQLLYGYLTKRSHLRGLVVLMDIRHPLNALDQQMLQWAVKRPVPVCILLTKKDKLSQTASSQQVELVRSKVKNLGGDITVESFSSLKKLGIEKLQQILDNWLI